MGQLSFRDHAGPSSGIKFDEFVASTASEMYDAWVGGPNQEFGFKTNNDPNRNLAQI